MLLGYNCSAKSRVLSRVSTYKLKNIEVQSRDVNRCRMALRSGLRQNLMKAELEHHDFFSPSGTSVDKAQAEKAGIDLMLRNGVSIIRGKVL